MQAAGIDPDKFVRWTGEKMISLASVTCVKKVLMITGEPDIPGREAVSTRRSLSTVGTRSGSEAMLPLFQTGRPLPGPKGYPNTNTSMPILTDSCGEPILFIG